MKKIQSISNYLFDVAAAPFVLGFFALLGIGVVVVALVVVAIVLIVRASKKRRVGASTAVPADSDKNE